MRQLPSTARPGTVPGRRATRLLRATLLGATLLGAAPALAQSSGPGWFVPGGAAGGAGAPAHAVRPHPVRRAEPAPTEAMVPAPVPQPDTPVPQGPPPPLPQPAVPSLPALPKGAAPPAAVIGVLSVPDVMHASSAAQQVEKIISQRRAQLNEDAQKEQGVWQKMQQALEHDHTHLTAAELRDRDRALQQRVLNAQREFRDRNRIIQEAGQVGLGQIERELISVIRQVAESRGMNLVLHREQVVLNVAGFDITDQVATELNRILPTVTIPGPNQDPEKMAAAQPAPAPATAAAAKAPAKP